MKNEKITFGEHKGKTFGEIPASYKLAMWHEFKDSFDTLKNTRLKKFLKNVKEEIDQY